MVMHKYPRHFLGGIVMYHFVYKTTNIVNGHFYIGVHSTVYTIVNPSRFYT